MQACSDNEHGSVSVMIRSGPWLGN